jgi:hypothetical protein
MMPHTLLNIYGYFFRTVLLLFAIFSSFTAHSQNREVERKIENSTATFVVDSTSNFSFSAEEKSAFNVAAAHLDKYLHLQPDYSGVCHVGEPGELKILQNITKRVPFPGGYFYVFITNRSAQSVYFNNLHIVRKKETIRQKQDYYPYGLTWENISEEELRNGA